MSSLPKTVTRQRRGCDLNPGPSAPESSTLTTRPPACRLASEKSARAPGDDVDDERIADDAEDERGQVDGQRDDTDDALIVHTHAASGRTAATRRVARRPRDVPRHHVAARPGTTAHAWFLMKRDTGRITRKYSSNCSLCLHSSNIVGGGVAANSI